MFTTLTLTIAMALATPSDTNVRGIMAIRGHFKHVTPAFAARILTEGREILAKPGNRWFPIHWLIGMAINESDLRYWLRIGLDCGAWQNRVNQFSRKRWRQKQLCYQLSRSTKLSAEYAMRELNRYRGRYCRRFAGKSSRAQIRCALSIYRQGPFWLSRSRRQCKIHCDPLLGERRCARLRYRCRRKNRYWLRAACFAMAVHLGRKPRRNCRRAQSLAWILRAFRLQKMPGSFF